MASERERSVLARVRSVPEGYVTTYGAVSPGSPRFAGAVLAHTAEDVPWQRVVRADGSLAQGARQRALLEAEGVPFRGSRVDLGEALIPPEALTSRPNDDK
ncbi:MAG: MGMT family protein [Actinobacteria bacterium]|nr:MGMT family protein [Actinomycetota bacterium]